MGVTIAEQKASEKNDYEILFKDSSEYFLVKNAKMIQEGQQIRFICFDSRLPIARFMEDQYYPIGNIHRIKRYAQPQKVTFPQSPQPNE